MTQILILKMIALIFKAFMFGWIITYFEPLQYIFEKIKAKIKSKNFFINYLKEGISCHKCLTFNSAWIMALMVDFTLFNSLIIASSAALTVYVFDILIFKLRK